MAIEIDLCRAISYSIVVYVSSMSCLRKDRLGMSDHSQRQFMRSNRGPMKLDEILRHAREVGRKTTYPITSADQLVDALGGDQATQRIGNKDHQVVEVRQIPAAYFPIESEADFIAKITRVLVLSGEPVEDQLTGGESFRGECFRDASRCCRLASKPSQPSTAPRSSKRYRMEITPLVLTFARIAVSRVECRLLE